jgi:hypothetical protein
VRKIAHVVAVREGERESERVIARPVLRLKVVFIVGNPFAYPEVHCLRKYVCVGTRVHVRAHVRNIQV